MLWKNFSLLAYRASSYLRRSGSNPLAKGAYFLGAGAFDVAGKVRNICLTKIMPRPDYGSESAFWHALFSGLGDAEMLHYLGVMLDKKRRKAFFPRKMRVLAAKARMGKKAASVLEIGAGPISLLAYGVDAGLLKVSAVDPLAGEYNLIMANHGIEYPVKPIAMRGEDMAHKFSPGSFDIVYMSNSLDHVEVPAEVLRNTVFLVREGGFVFIEGAAREGSAEKWTGLHQHDLFISGGKLFRAGKDGQRQCISSRLGLRCVYQEKMPYSRRFPGCPNGKEWFAIVFRKISAIT